MQPAASQTPPGRHRRPKRSDRVVLGLRIATFVVAAGLIGAVVLLVTGGADNRPAAGRSPAIPTIDSSRGASEVPAPPTETSSSPAIETPEFQTHTADIVAAPAPTTTTTPAPTQSSQPPPFPFAVIGERCDNPGSLSVTREGKAVICARSSRGSFRWRQVS